MTVVKLPPAAQGSSGISVPSVRRIAVVSTGPNRAAGSSLGSGLSAWSLQFLLTSTFLSKNMHIRLIEDSKLQVNHKGRCSFTIVGAGGVGG